RRLHAPPPAPGGRRARPRDRTRRPPVSSAWADPDVGVQRSTWKLTHPVRRWPTSPVATSLASSYFRANRVAGFGAQIRPPPALHIRALRAESCARPARNSSPRLPRGDTTVVANEPSSTEPRGASP